MEMKKWKRKREVTGKNVRESLRTGREKDNTTDVAVVCEIPGVCEKYVSMLHSEGIVNLMSREYAQR